MKMYSRVFNFKEGEKDLSIDHSLLTQKKAPSMHMPVTLTKPQNWEDLMARTLDANCMINPGSNCNQRRLKENLYKTKRTLQPELQPTVNCLNNKITGCVRGISKQTGHQTYQIGQENEIDTIVSKKGQIFFEQALKSKIFQNLEQLDISQANHLQCGDILVEDSRHYMAKKS